MADLTDVLELLHRRGPRFRTLRVAGREWRRHSLLHEAFREAFLRDRPEGSVVTSFRPAGDAEAADEGEEPWRMWAEPPDRMRVEFAVGNETVTAVFHGDTWWSWSPSLGGRTNGGRANAGHGIGPGEGLVDPSIILPAVELEVLGRAEALGRPVHRVRAVPLPEGEPGPSLALHVHGSGADEYELLIDAERGFFLRSEARLRGEPFRVVEMTDLALDEDLPDDLFTLVLPEGQSFTAFDPVPGSG